jgi:hypothetical protein
MKVLRDMTFRDWLALFLLNAFVAVMFYLLRNVIPKENEQLIVYMLGQLSGFTGTALAIYFTLSKHDEQREQVRSENTTKLTDTVAALAQNATTTQPGPSGNPGDPVHTVEENR